MRVTAPCHHLVHGTLLRGSQLTFVLDKTAMTVGHDDAACDVCLPSSRRVEAQHALISFDDKRQLFVVMDLGSAQGVRVLGFLIIFVELLFSSSSND